MTSAQDKANPPPSVQIFTTFLLFTVLHCAPSGIRQRPSASLIPTRSVSNFTLCDIVVSRRGSNQREFA
jgi:hypothetical protein